MNNSLSISIPTFNRTDILEENLLLMIADVKEYSIPIYISDDSSNDNTKAMIDEMKCKYKHIYYNKNSPSLGHDKNCFHTLSLPSTDYVWYLGDALIIKPGAIKKIINIINEYQPDLLAVNECGRSLDVASTVYSNAKNVLTDLGWHLTMTGVTIYSRAVISSMNEVSIENFKNFPQFAIIFNYLSKQCSFYWLNEKLISTNIKKESYWPQKGFEIFLYDWKNTVYNLPEYYDGHIKDRVIVEHSFKTNVFGLKSMIRFRRNGVLTMQSLKRYRQDLSTHSNLHYSTLLIIAMIPVIVINVMLKLRNIFTRGL